MIAAKAASSPERFDEAFLRKLEALSFVAKRTRGGDARAERRSRRVGAGVEFADHREYAPGDDVRGLDWNLFARLDRPFVRLRQEEENLALTVMVDSSGSMATGTPPKMELAARLGAALAYVGLAGLDRVGVALVATGVEEALSPLRGKPAVSRVLELLGRARARGRTDLVAAVGEVHRESGRTRRGLTVLVSDLLEPSGCLPVLDRLRAARQEAVVVQVTADEDATLADEEDGEVLLEDIESGETRALVITPATRRGHAARYQALLRGVADACRKRAVPYFQIASQVPFEHVVLRILRGAGVLA